jgi:hypothetical protein
VWLGCVCLFGFNAVGMTVFSGQDLKSEIDLNVLNVYLSLCFVCFFVVLLAYVFEKFTLFFLLCVCQCCFFLHFRVQGLGPGPYIFVCVVTTACAFAFLCEEFCFHCLGDVTW